ncbi:MAG: DUF2889 domain-containing protein [Pseudomonadota bacterium]
MPLPSPAPRQAWHTRKVTFHGYKRDDGLWDIEGELIDTKPRELKSPEKGLMPPGTPIHHMLARITLDDDFTVVAIAASMESTPFPECGGALVNLQKLVGVRAASGWRQAIHAAMGRTDGCTHMRELILNLGTAAYQTLSSHKRKATEGQPLVRNLKPPPHLGQCMAWDFDGAVVKRHKPEFFGWRKPEKAVK